MRGWTAVGVLLVVVLVAVSAVPLTAQVGKSQGLADVNTAPEADLLKMPHMTPAVVKAILAARPFASPIDLNKLLVAQKLTPEQAQAFYRSAFVHINLNTATGEEIMLIPGAGKRMAHEFEEYRPWKAWAQFDKEIGKYVNAQEVARLAQYGFIPMDPNTASDADLQTIPGVGPRMLRELKEYRPWKSRAHFDKEIGKYVEQKEVARLARYLTLP
jgi:DNA uptake protein ComE-like DNA-binding protein